METVQQNGRSTLFFEFHYIYNLFSWRTSCSTSCTACALAYTEVKQSFLNQKYLRGSLDLAGGNTMHQRTEFFVM